MAINKNHEFEELNGVKCGIVEKNVSHTRAAFLIELLEFNHFAVIVAPSPPPKAAPAPKVAEGEVAPIAPIENLPETFTVGVTDYTFNAINAIYGRLLKAPNGKIVTAAYWYQQELVNDDSVPYYEKK